MKLAPWPRVVGLSLAIVVASCGSEKVDMEEADAASNDAGPDASVQPELDTGVPPDPDAGPPPDPDAAVVPALVPLHSYQNATLRDHYYTSAEDHASIEARGYVYEHVEGYVWNAEVPETVALHRYWSEAVGDHLYTTRPEDEMLDGYVDEGIEGYVSPVRVMGSVPFHRVFCARQDHAYTSNDFQRHIWTLTGCTDEGAEGYLWPYRDGTMPDGHCYDSMDCAGGETCMRESRFLPAPPIVSVCTPSCMSDAQCPLPGAACVRADPIDAVDLGCSEGCDLLTNERCREATHCVLRATAGGDFSSGCTAHGGMLGSSDACSDPDECGVGLHCFRDVCRARCRVGVASDCVSGTTCDTLGEAVTFGADSWGLCL